MDPILMTRAGSSGRGCPFQRRQQVAGEKEQRLEVEVGDLVEALFGEGLDRFAPGGAGVVDQYVEPLFTVADVGNQRLHAFHRRQIGRQRDTTTDRRQFAGNFVADLGGSRGDVDRGARLDIAAGDHQPDAARAAGDQCGLAPDRKQGRDVDDSGCRCVLHREPPIGVPGAQSR